MPKSDPLTKEQRRLRSRIGAHKLHGLYDSRELTANGRAAFLGKFLEEADPEGVLSPEERERRAAHLRKAHFTAMALKSAKARAKKAS